jgi:hypothetical protein
MFPPLALWLLPVRGLIGIPVTGRADLSGCQPCSAGVLAIMRWPQVADTSRLLSHDLLMASEP